jgi:hypothetical protein
MAAKSAAGKLPVVHPGLSVNLFRGLTSLTASKELSASLRKALEEAEAELSQQDADDRSLCALLVSFDSLVSLFAALLLIGHAITEFVVFSTDTGDRSWWPPVGALLAGLFVLAVTILNAVLVSWRTWRLRWESSWRIRSSIESFDHAIEAIVASSDKVSPGEAAGRLAALPPPVRFHTHTRAANVVLVYRDARWVRLPPVLLVAGDVIALQVNQFAPANCEALDEAPIQDVMSSVAHAAASVTRSLQSLPPVHRRTLRSGQAVRPPVPRRLLAGQDFNRRVFSSPEMKPLRPASAHAAGLEGTLPPLSAGGAPPPSVGASSAKGNLRSVIDRATDLLTVCGDLRRYRLLETPGVATVKALVTHPPRPSPLIRTELDRGMQSLQRALSVCMLVTVVGYCIQAFLDPQPGSSTVWPSLTLVIGSQADDAALTFTSWGSSLAAALSVQLVLWTCIALPAWVQVAEALLTAHTLAHADSAMTGLRWMQWRRSLRKALGGKVQERQAWNEAPMMAAMARSGKSHRQRLKGREEHDGSSESEREFDQLDVLEELMRGSDMADQSTSSSERASMSSSSHSEPAPPPSRGGGWCSCKWWCCSRHGRLQESSPSAEHDPVKADTRPASATSVRTDATTVSEGDVAGDAATASAFITEAEGVEIELPPGLRTGWRAAQGAGQGHFLAGVPASVPAGASSPTGDPSAAQRRYRILRKFGVAGWLPGGAPVPETLLPRQGRAALHTDMRKLRRSRAKAKSEVPTMEHGCWWCKCSRPIVQDLETCVSAAALAETDSRGWGPTSSFAALATSWETASYILERAQKTSADLLSSRATWVAMAIRRSVEEAGPSGTLSKPNGKLGGGASESWRPRRHDVCVALFEWGALLRHALTALVGTIVLGMAHACCKWTLTARLARRFQCCQEDEEDEGDNLVSLREVGEAGCCACWRSEAQKIEGEDDDSVGSAVSAGQGCCGCLRSRGSFPLQRPPGPESTSETSPALLSPGSSLEHHTRELDRASVDTIEETGTSSSSGETFEDVSSSASSRMVWAGWPWDDAARARGGDSDSDVDIDDEMNFQAGPGEGDTSAAAHAVADASEATAHVYLPGEEVPGLWEVLRGAPNVWDVLERALDLMSIQSARNSVFGMQGRDPLKESRTASHNMGFLPLGYPLLGSGAVFRVGCATSVVAADRAAVCAREPRAQSLLLAMGANRTAVVGMRVGDEVLDGAAPELDTGWESYVEAMRPIALASAVTSRRRTEGWGDGKAAVRAAVEEAREAAAALAFRAKRAAKRAERNQKRRERSRQLKSENPKGKRGEVVRATTVPVGIHVGLQTMSESHLIDALPPPAVGKPSKLLDRMQEIVKIPRGGSSDRIRELKSEATGAPHPGFGFARRWIAPSSLRGDAAPAEQPVSEHAPLMGEEPLSSPDRQGGSPARSEAMDSSPPASPPPTGDGAIFASVSRALTAPAAPRSLAVQLEPSVLSQDSTFADDSLPQSALEESASYWHSSLPSPLPSDSQPSHVHEYSAGDIPQEDSLLVAGDARDGSSHGDYDTDDTEHVDEEYDDAQRSGENTAEHLSPLMRGESGSPTPAAQRSRSGTWEGGTPNEDTGSDQHHEDTASDHHHEDTASDHHHEDTASDHHHEDTASDHHHEDTASDHHHEDTASDHHHEDTASDHHHEDTASDHHHEDTASDHHLGHCGGSDQAIARSGSFNRSAGESPVDGSIRGGSEGQIEKPGTDWWPGDQPRRAVRSGGHVSSERSHDQEHASPGGEGIESSDPFDLTQIGEEPTIMGLPPAGGERLFDSEGPEGTQASSAVEGYLHSASSKPALRIPRARTRAARRRLRKDMEEKARAALGDSGAALMRSTGATAKRQRRTIGPHTMRIVDSAAAGDDARSLLALASATRRVPPFIWLLPLTQVVGVGRKALDVLAHKRHVHLLSGPGGDASGKSKPSKAPQEAAAATSAVLPMVVATSMEVSATMGDLKPPAEALPMSSSFTFPLAGRVVGAPATISRLKQQGEDHLSDNDDGDDDTTETCSTEEGTPSAKLPKPRPLPLSATTISAAPRVPLSPAQPGEDPASLEVSRAASGGGKSVESATDDLSHADLTARELVDWIATLPPGFISKASLLPRPSPRGIPWLGVSVTTTVVRDRRTDGLHALTAGSAQAVIKRCSEHWDGRSIWPLDEARRKELMKVAERWRAEGMTVAALAYDPVSAKERSVFDGLDRAARQEAEHERQEAEAAKTMARHADSKARNIRHAISVGNRTLVDLEPREAANHHLDIGLSVGPSSVFLLGDGGASSLQQLGMASPVAAPGQDESGAKLESYLRSLQQGQILLGLVGARYEPRPRAPVLIEGLKASGIRFAYMSPRKWGQARPLAEKLGLATGWNTAISLRERDASSMPGIVVPRDGLGLRVKKGSSPRFLPQSLLQAAPNAANSAHEGFVVADDDDEGMMEGIDGGWAAMGQPVRQPRAAGEREGQSWDDKAKLPHGLREVRRHLEEVDNVPLLVNLFTECTPENIAGMTRIMQRFGEAPVVMSSALRYHSPELFRVGDSSIALIPDEAEGANALHPSIFSSKLQSSKDILEAGSLPQAGEGVRHWGRSSVSSRVPHPFLSLAASLASLPASFALPSSAPLSTVLAIVRDARRGVASFAQALVVWAAAALGVAMIKAVAAIMILPDPLPALWCILILFVFTPLIITGMLFAPAEPGIMGSGRTPSKRVRDEIGQRMWSVIDPEHVSIAPHIPPPSADAATASAGAVLAAQAAALMRAAREQDLPRIVEPNAETCVFVARESTCVGSSFASHPDEVASLDSTSALPCSVRCSELGASCCCGLVRGYVRCRATEHCTTWSALCIWCSHPSRRYSSQGIAHAASKKIRGKLLYKWQSMRPVEKAEAVGDDTSRLTAIATVATAISTTLPKRSVTVPVAEGDEAIAPPHSISPTASLPAKSPMQSVIAAAEAVSKTVDAAAPWAGSTAVWRPRIPISWRQVPKPPLDIPKAGPANQDMVVLVAAVALAVSCAVASWWVFAESMTSGHPIPRALLASQALGLLTAHLSVVSLSAVFMWRGSDASSVFPWQNVPWMWVCGTTTAVCAAVALATGGTDAPWWIWLGAIAWCVLVVMPVAVWARSTSAADWEKLQRRRRFDFDTKLGMHSPR